MIPFAPILEELDTRIKARLAPLLQINGWELNAIVTEDFSNIESFDALIERYRTKLPGAFLSIPSVTFQTVPPRVPHFTADYQFLAGAKPRHVGSKSQGFAFTFMDKACRELYLQKILDIDLPCNLDFLRPRAFSFTEVQTDAGPIGVALLTFSLEVRNWEINSPA